MDERLEHDDSRSDLDERETGYPRRLIAASARLLDVQYRLWHRDLKDPEPPLVEYGFRVSRDSAGIDGRACRYDASDGTATIILGATLVHGHPGGRAVAVDRRALTIFTAWIDEWSPAARIAGGAPADANALVPRLVSWIGGYEQWVLDTGRGEGSRPEIASAFGVEDELPGLWWRLAAGWRTALTKAPLSG